VGVLNKAVDNNEYCLRHHGWYCNAVECAKRVEIEDRLAS
jgi:hypothetical protein